MTYLKNSYCVVNNYINTYLKPDCYETCNECEEIGNWKEHKCNYCKDNYYKIKDKNNCYNESFIDNKLYYINESIISCNDFNNTCQKCSYNKNNNKFSCLECSYYSIQIDEINNSIEKICINSSEKFSKYNNYYFDYSKNKYFKCHENCKECVKSSIKENDNCEICKEGYFFIENKKMNCFNESYLTNNFNNSYYHHVNNTYISFPNNLNLSNCSEFYNEKYEFLYLNITSCKENYTLENDLNLCRLNCNNNFYIIMEENNNNITCVNNCSKLYNLNYTFGNRCVKNCENYYILNNKHCYAECPEGSTPIKDRCINNLLLNGNEHNISFLHENLIQLENNIDDFVIDIFYSNLSFHSNDYYLQVFNTTNIPYHDEISEIIFDDCVASLKKYYNIPDEENLIIAKFDLFRPKKLHNQVEYHIFTKNGIRLQLKVCENDYIIIKYPILYPDKISFNLGKEIYELKGNDIYNNNDSFFNDICNPYSSNGTDVILADRRKEIFQDVSFCEENCKYLKVNYTTQKIECKCNVKEYFNNEEKELNKDSINFGEIFSLNIEVMKCFKYSFQWKILSKNLGFWIMTTFLILQIILIFLFLFEKNILKNNIIHNIFLTSPPIRFNSIDLDNDSNNDSNPNNLSSDKRLKKKIIIYNKNEFKKIKKIVTFKKSFFLNKKFLNSNKSMNYYFIIEKNYDFNLPFLEEIENEKNFFKIFFTIFKNTFPIFRSIFLISKYELICLNISVYIFSLSINFTLNGLFFTNNVISDRHKGSISFISTILRSIYSTLIGILIMVIPKNLIFYFPLMETIIREVKNQIKLSIYLKKILKILIIKISFYFIFMFIFNIIFIYYITCFCAIYKYSQLEWFLGGLRSFLITFLISFVTSLIITILRFISLILHNIYIYDISLYFYNLFKYL